MTSEVSAILEDRISLFDIFKAIFPCGSITGAPKVSTMKVIDELCIFLMENDMIAIGGYIVCEYPKEDIVQKDYDGYRIKLCRRYASSEILILEREN